MTQVCHKINLLKFLLFCVKICTLILTFIENPVSSYTTRRKACPRPQLLTDTSSLRWQFACQLFAQVGLMQVLLLHCFCTLLALAHFLLTTICLTLYNIERGQAHFMCAPLKILCTKLGRFWIADRDFDFFILDFRFWLLHFDVGGQSGCSRVFVQRDV